MFRRWRRARLAAQAAAHTAPAPSPRATAADLRGEHIFELVNARLSRFIGPDGQWSLVRRTDADSDRIFQAMLTHQTLERKKRFPCGKFDTQPRWLTRRGGVELHEGHGPLLSPQRDMATASRRWS